MKKFLVVILTLLLLIGLIACGNSSGDNSSTTAAVSAESNSNASLYASSDENSDENLNDSSEESLDESSNDNSNESSDVSSEESSDVSTEESSEESSTLTSDPSTLNYQEITYYDYVYARTGVFLSIDYDNNDYINKDYMIYAYVKEWDEYFPILAYYHVPTVLYEYVFGASLCGDTAWITFVDSSFSYRFIYTIKLTRGSETFETQSFYTKVENNNIFNMFCNFYDENSGSLFIVNNKTYWQFTIYKTNDGGKTWYSLDSDDALHSNRHEKLMMAKFVSDKIGIVAYRYFEDPDLCKRTYLTKDGGATWTLLSGIQYPFDIKNNSYGEAVDLQFNEGIYTLKVHVYDGDNGYDIHYSSNDLSTWSLEE